MSFDQDFNFQLLGKAEEGADSYVAIGLSLDDSMVCKSNDIFRFVFIVQVL